MRLRLLAGSLAAASVIFLACSSDDTVTIPPAEAGASSSGSSGASSGSSGTSSGDDSGAADAAPDTSKLPTSTDCSIMPIAAIPDVTPDFVVLSTTVQPPAQTGGTLSGTYTVTKATVYLPAEIALVSGGAAPTGTGTVNAWSVFKGTRYLLHNNVNLMVTAGKQSLPIATAVDSQGGFTTAAEKLTLDYSCDTKQPDQADYTFTDDGSGTATILVKTSTVYMGFTLTGYLLLTATKS